jgi:hypothetical protein
MTEDLLQRLVLEVVEFVDESGEVNDVEPISLRTGQATGDHRWRGR